MRKLIIATTAAILAIGTSGCTTLAAGAAGAAAASLYQDENDVCDPPTSAGVLDSDCN